MRRRKSKYISKVEKDIARYLSSYFELHPQFIIDVDYFHPYDMLLVLPNGIHLLIEYDGDKWHKGGWKDKQRELNAKRNGYAFLVIKESEYKTKGGMRLVKKRVAKYYPELLTYSLSKSKEIKKRNLGRVGL